MSATDSTALDRPVAAPIDAPITGGEIETLFRLANGLAQSQFFKDAKQAQQAFAKLIFGRDLGLSATQAMTDIYIVEGKPEMSANLQAAKVRSSNTYDYRIDELTDERCELTFLRDGVEQSPTSVFTMQDATKAKLANKDNWKNYPRNMLFARAMSNGVAWHCPDVMNGIRVYAEGEVAESAPVRVQSAGQPEETVEGTAEPEDAALTDEERAKLGELIEASGLSDDELQMHLAAVGVDCTDDLTARTAEELRALLDRGSK